MMYMIPEIYAKTIEKKITSTPEAIYVVRRHRSQLVNKTIYPNKVHFTLDYITPIRLHTVNLRVVLSSSSGWLNQLDKYVAEHKNNLKK